MADNSPGALAALSQPCREALRQAPVLRDRARISDHQRALLRLDDDNFLVANENGCFLGLATRNRIAEPPRARLILVDHNELSAEALAPEVIGFADNFVRES